MGRAMGKRLVVVLILKYFVNFVLTSTAPPYYIRARANDPHTVTVSWHVRGDGDPSRTTYRIGWRVDSPRNRETYVAVNGTLGYYVFHNLRPYTYYYFRVQKGVIGGSYGPFSRSRWIETPESVPTAPPSNVTAYSTSARSILMSWGVVPSKQRNGHILGYRTCYYKAIDVPSSKLCLSVYAHSNHLGNLSPYTPYYVTVLAYTNVGDGPSSKKLLVWTEQFVPSQAPELQSLTSTPTSVSVAWKPIPRQFVNGILKGYTVFCKEKNKNKKQIKQLNSTTLSYKFTDLQQNTMYEIQLSGMTTFRGQLSLGVVSTAWNISTKKGIDRPNNVKAFSPCPQCMMVEWEQVTSHPVRILGYRLKLSSRDQDDVTIDATADLLKINVTGLNPYTKYTIQVAARTEWGLGQFSTPIIEATQEGVPGAAPQHVKIRTLGSRSLLVTWSPLDPNVVNGNLQGYYVYYNYVNNKKKRSNTGVSRVSNVSASSIVINGLQPFSSYEVSVSGFTKKGNGPSSPPMTVRTHEEVPNSAPQGITVNPLNENALLVSWQPLSKQHRNGILKGYHVHYRRKTSNTSIIKNAVTVNATSVNVPIKGLEPDTQYEVWIRAFTAKGPGPRSKKATAKTLAKEPGQVQNVRVTIINPRTVEVTWFSIVLPGSHVTRYMVKWMRRGDVVGSVENSQKVVQVSEKYVRLATITGLLPYNMYTFTVREMYDGKIWGGLSSPVDQMMPEDSPSAPLELSVYKKQGPNLVLSWRKPTQPNGVIRKYVVEFGDHDGRPLWEQTVVDSTSQDSLKLKFILPDKTATYLITVQAFNSLAGKKSKVITVQHVSMDEIVEFTKKDKDVIKLPWLILIISAVGLFLLGLLVFVLIRKSRKKPKQSHEEEIISMIPRSVGARKPIPISQLKHHCDRYHAYDDGLFIEEFKSLNHVPLRATYEASQALYNKRKNRYPNILPYDHSRVGLKARKDSPAGHDYINASFIDGYNFPRKYIATQGPLLDTVDDFWRMIWEKTCTAIVMLGDDESSPKVHSDCERYWPEHGYQEYGNLAVSIVEETHMTDWKTRTFLIWSTDPDCMDKREITQYQFSGWPDQGVPNNTSSLLTFQHKLKMAIPLDTNGSIVVHCSAGVGRTGTFIAIDSLLEQSQTEGVVDVCAFVAQMRTQRNYMVQTEDQYAYIHDVLRDACICGTTEIKSNELGPKLLAVSDTDLETLKQRNNEYDNLPVHDLADFQQRVAMIRENIVKNRCPDILPFDRNRVSLTMDGANSDYINASFIDSYNEKAAYIATQAPMENTVMEFWQMVWEQRCTAIVMLSDLTDEAGHEESVVYWPDQGCLRYGKYIVTKIDEEKLDYHTQRVLKLRCHGSPDNLLIYHFQFHNWAHTGVPSRTNSILYLHEQVQKIQLAEDHGPTIVHCSDGASRTGVYLNLALCIERLEAEDNIDIYQTVRWLRSQRPGIIGNEGQYNFCYKAIKNYLSWRIRATNAYVIT